MKVLRFHWSTYVVGFFGLLLFAVGFFAEVFQAPPIPQEISQLIKNPLPMEQLKRLRRVSFTNKMGKFKFENSHPDGLVEGPWQMIEPTNIKARKDFFVKMLSALEEIQIRHTHRNETINLQSFSLDRPLFGLRLEPMSGKPLEVNFGLINPIDNSTYFSLSDDNWIYQCNTLAIPFETVTPDELLDSKVLALNVDLISSIEIASYPFQTPGIRIQRQETDWFDQEGKKLDGKKVESFLRDLQQLKSYMVLDRLTPGQAVELERVLTTPRWRLRMTNAGAAPETFYMTGELEALADLRLERKGSVLFYREGTRNPLVLNGAQLNFMNKKVKDLR